MATNIISDKFKRYFVTFPLKGGLHLSQVIVPNEDWCGGKMDRPDLLLITHFSNSSPDWQSLLLSPGN